MENSLIFQDVQKEEPKQQKEELTLEDISPKWAARLNKNKLPTFMSLTWFKWYSELKYGSKCVVGEAHGYSSSYFDDCNTCDDISRKFMYYFGTCSNKKLEQGKHRFVKHWNEKHIM
jgi:hypothetical protein